MTASFYILSAYGTTLIVFLSLATAAFIQRRRLRQKQMQISNK